MIIYYYTIDNIAVDNDDRWSS